ncbi:MAG: glycosyltransferase [Planctomycetota bacterium]
MPDDPAPAETAQRVLIVMPSLAAGGAERQALMLAAALRDAGEWQPTVAVLKGEPGAGALQGGATGPGIEPVHISGGVRGLSRWIDAQSPVINVVQSVLLNRQVALACAMLRKARPRPRVVFSLRSSGVTDGRWMTRLVWRWVDAMLARSYAHAIIANSAAAVEWAARSGYPRQRLHMVPNAVEVGTSPQPEHRPHIGRQPLVVAVGNLRAVKGHAVLLDAWRDLQPAARLQIVGEGAERAALEARLPGGVELLGHRNDVPDLLRAADVFVHPSLSEGWPNAVAEALLAGCAVIATDVGETPTIVGDAGEIVPAGDARALAAALRRVLGDVPAARQRAEAGRERLIRDYSPAALAARTAAIYRSAPDPRGGARG